MRIVHRKRPKRRPRARTERRRRHAERAIERERARVPLLAEQLDWETPDERLARHERGTERRERALRQLEADGWRRARRWLRRVDPATRGQILAHWNGHRWYPKTGLYFVEVVRRELCRRGIDPEADLERRKEPE